MNILSFNEFFPDEASSRAKFKEYRDDKETEAWQGKPTTCKVLENLKGETIDKHIESFIDPSSTIITDGFKGYLKTKGKVAEHEKHIVPPKEASVVLPWVHILIANAKRVLLGTYHLMNTKHIQQYLNEFCYKANRWYDGEILFKRLLIATVSTTWKHLVHV